MYHLVLQEQHLKVFHLVFRENGDSLVLACPEKLTRTKKTIILLFKNLLFAALNPSNSIDTKKSNACCT